MAEKLMSWYTTAINHSLTTRPTCWVRLLQC